MRGPSRRCFCFVRRRTNVPDLVIVGTFLRARSEWFTNEVRHDQVESRAIPYSGLGRRHSGSRLGGSEFAARTKTDRSSKKGGSALRGRRYLRIRVFNRTEAAGLKGRAISFGDYIRSSSSTTPLAARYRCTVPARREARRAISMQSLPDQLAAAREGRLRELRWKNSAWLVTADTIAGWNGFEIRNAGSGRSPVRKRSG
jgi:hypothetical protein